jgi:hypothetical protein
VAGYPQRGQPPGGGAKRKGWCCCCSCLVVIGAVTGLGILGYVVDERGKPSQPHDAASPEAAAAIGELFPPGGAAVDALPGGAPASIRVDGRELTVTAAKVQCVSTGRDTALWDVSVTVDNNTGGGVALGPRRLMVMDSGESWHFTTLRSGATDRIPDPLVLPAGTGLVVAGQYELTPGTAPVQLGADVDPNGEGLILRYNGREFRVDGVSQDGFVDMRRAADGAWRPARSTGLRKLEIGGDTVRLEGVDLVQYADGHPPATALSLMPLATIGGVGPDGAPVGGAASAPNATAPMSGAEHAPSAPPGCADTVRRIKTGVAPHAERDEPVNTSPGN